ncbi:hypothetical protein AB0I55_25085 [Actinocatenispora sera]
MINAALGGVAGCRHPITLKGLMTWSINGDGSKGWTFGDNVKALEGS